MSYKLNLWHWLIDRWTGYCVQNVEIFYCLIHFSLLHPTPCHTNELKSPSERALKSNLDVGSHMEGTTAHVVVVWNILTFGPTVFQQRTRSNEKKCESNITSLALRNDTIHDNNTSSSYYKFFAKRIRSCLLTLFLCTSVMHCRIGATLTVQPCTAQPIWIGQHCLRLLGHIAWQMRM